MGENYQKLVKHLADIVNLGAVEGLLGWDQQVNLPPAAAEARAAQMAVLSRIRHEMATSDETGRLIETAERELEGADYDSDEASTVRVARRDFDEETKLPTDFVEEQTRVTGLAHEVWVHARANNDFRSFQPTLERILELKQREAEYRGYTDHPYDALLGQYERGRRHRCARSSTSTSRRWSA